MFHTFARYEKRRQEIISQKRDQYLKPILAVLTKCGIKADYVTYSSILLLLIGAFVIGKYPLWGGIIFLSYCLLDGIDGPLSRYQDSASIRGSLLDICADQAGVLILPIFSMAYFGADPIFAYTFGLFYILYIIFVVILNVHDTDLLFVLRVKYVYYLIFF